MSKSEAILNAATELQLTFRDGSMAERATLIEGVSSLDREQAERYVISQILIKHLGDHP